MVGKDSNTFPMILGTPSNSIGMGRYEIFRWDEPTKVQVS